MRKLKTILPVLMIALVFNACGNGEQKGSSSDSSGIGPAKDSTSSTTLPDTMYDNVNQDSIQ